MPVPCNGHRPSFPRTKIPDSVDRGLTLKQLRELREFTKRLCKVGLLEYPDSAYNQTLNRVGHSIKWTQITQNEIVTEIIKKIIPEKLVQLGRIGCS